MRLFFSTFLLATLTVALSAVSIAPSCAQQSPLYKNSKAPLQARVDDLLGRMTDDEKLTMLGGTGFTTQPIPRLGVPAMSMADAGQGVRGGSSGTQGPATLFSSEIVMASTWDTQLVGRIGQAIGEEVQNKGTGAQVLLGPDVNIHRSPMGGRNGESFTEDPFLNAQLATSYIKGLQSTGASACVKHFAANNEEIDRMTVDVRVSERALREIYFPAFKASVQQAHVWSIMPSYNLVNGFHSTANRFLLTDVARKDWGFDGLMISDWGAVHETVGAVNAGNDLEMPTGDFLNPPALRAALANGSITQAQIDNSVRHILTTVIRVGLLDRTPSHNHSLVNSPAHQNLAYQTAAGGIILLKNRNSVLPLNAGRIRSLAVIGPGAVDLQAGAAGSPAVTPVFQSTPLDGIKNRVGKSVKINYAEGIVLPKTYPESIGTESLTPPDAAPGRHGVRAEYFNNDNLEGSPLLTRIEPQMQFFGQRGAPLVPGLDPVHFSIRETGTITAPVTGHYTIAAMTRANWRVYLDNKLVIDTIAHPANYLMGYFAARYDVDLVAGHKYAVRLEAFGSDYGMRGRLAWTVPGVNEIDSAVAAAKQSDAAVVIVSTIGTEGEGQDRPSLALPADQDRLIQAVAAVNKRTIVVLNNGTPVLMTHWIGQVPGLIEAYFPGEQAGRAIAAILFGDVNPSGKLPDTLAARREDYPDYGNYPGKNDVVHYAEGIYVGYRHFDKSHIAPLFPFGYGLSYTTFRYSGLRLSKPTLSPNGTVTATADITNTGSRAGAEVVELYLRDMQPKEDRPIRELKGFDKISLAPGQTKTATFTLTPQSMAYFNAAGHQWKADAGTYMVEVGASSRDIRLSKPVKLTGVYTAKP